MSDKFLKAERQIEELAITINEAKIISDKKLKDAVEFIRKKILESFDPEAEASVSDCDCHQDCKSLEIWLNGEKFDRCL
jgi:hypothetical protein